MRALLLIADIGGYTRFLSVHRINLTHAQEVIARLLEAVLDASKTFQLAKLEGDAVFLYRQIPEGQEAKVMATLGDELKKIRGAFLEARADLAVNRMCSCEGCVQAGRLTLKFVAHQGEVALQRIKHHVELAGIDVVFVHRLLKNSVPIREYALMSQPVLSHVSEPLRALGQPVQEELEGIGAIEAAFVDLQALPTVVMPVQPSRWRMFTNWFRMTRRGLPYMLGLKKPCEGFRNLETLALPAPQGEQVQSES